MAFPLDERRRGSSPDGQSRSPVRRENKLEIRPGPIPDRMVRNARPGSPFFGFSGESRMVMSPLKAPVSPPILASAKEQKRFRNTDRWREEWPCSKTDNRINAEAFRGRNSTREKSWGSWRDIRCFPRPEEELRRTLPVGA